MLDWGFIQAGGKSSRMGTDKAWLEIKNRPMIEHVVRAARPITKRMGIIVHAKTENIERYQDLVQNWDVELISDLHDYRGPLGGIHTALDRCHGGTSVLMLACDMPFISAEILLLLGQIHRSEKNELTMPVDQFGRSQPLAALYGSRCLPVVEQLLAENKLRVDGIYRFVKLRKVSYHEFAQLPGAERFFLNINTAADHLEHSVT